MLFVTIDQSVTSGAGGENAYTFPYDLAAYQQLKSLLKGKVIRIEWVKIDPVTLTAPIYIVAALSTQISAIPTSESETMIIGASWESIYLPLHDIPIMYEWDGYSLSNPLMSCSLAPSTFTVADTIVTRMFIEVVK